MPNVMRLFSCKAVLPALTTILFVACESEDPKLPLYLIAKVTTSSSTIEYTYEDEKATSTSTTTAGGTKVTGTFTYDGNGNIVEITYSDNVREVLTYSNGAITSRKKYDATNKLLSQWDYEYSGSQLTKVLFYEVASGVAYSAGFRTYEYEGSSADPARVKEFTSHTPTTPSSTSTYTYGVAKDAFSAAPAALKKYLRLLSVSTEKNVITIANGTKTWNYTYEFTEQDYPTKRTETSSTGQVYTIAYDYTVIN